MEDVTKKRTALPERSANTLYTINLKGLFRWEDDGVYDVDDAVGGPDIRSGYAGGAVEDRGLAVEGDGYEGFVGGGNGACL